MSAVNLLIDAAVLFAHEDIHDGWCCECCDGYCPGQDANLLRWDRLWGLTLDDDAYVTDRRLLIQTARLTVIPEGEVHELSGSAKTSLMKSLPPIPDERPSASTAFQSPRNMDRLDRAGLTVHGDTPKVHHLYQGDRHVGWTTVATRGISERADLDLTRKIAAEIGVSLARAYRALRMAQGEEAS